MSREIPRAAIKAKLRRRFYEAVVFLSALTRTWEDNRRPGSSDDPAGVSSPSNSSEANFKAFVNTLSGFCDVKPGGDSVTAMVVLDLQDRIQYRFACNRVKSPSLEKVKNFLLDLLTTLRDDESRDGLEQILLDKVLDHCQRRVCSYLKAFKAACSDCIATNPADQRVSDQLTQLQEAADFKFDNIRTFSQGCKQLMDLIEQSLSNSDASVFAGRVGQSGMSPSRSCWTELRHHAGRLKSYAVGIRTLMASVKTFPRLVEGFEVHCVRSSTADSNPILAKNVTAQEILGRMCGNEAQALPYRAMLEDTRWFDITTTIRSIVDQDTFRPIVHAELLVLQSLEQDKLLHMSSFLYACKYIGASKPTCRLCHEYFKVCNKGIEVRSTHNNLYINWKPPDVFQTDDKAAVKTAIEHRENMLNAIVRPIRDVGLTTLEDRMPVGREHDSSTGMTFQNPPMVLAEQAGVEVDMDTSFGDSDGTAMD